MQYITPGLSSLTLISVIFTALKTKHAERTNKWQPIYGKPIGFSDKQKWFVIGFLCIVALDFLDGLLFIY